MVLLYMYLHDLIKQDRFDLQVLKAANVSRCLDGFLFLKYKPMKIDWKLFIFATIRNGK